MPKHPRVVRVLPGTPGLAGGFAPAVLEWDELLVASIIKKAQQVSLPIQGGKQQATKSNFYAKLNKAEKMHLCALEHACFNHVVNQNQLIAGWDNIDLVILWAEPETNFQEWHLDTMEAIVAATVVAAGHPTPTEFADLNYRDIDVGDAEFDNVANAMDLPLDWTTLKPASRPSWCVAPKTLFPFKTNAMHRGPAIPKGAPARVSFFFSWGPHGHDPAGTDLFVNQTFFDSHRYKGVYVCMCVCACVCVCVCVCVIVHACPSLSSFFYTQKNIRSGGHAAGRIPSAGIL